MLRAGGAASPNELTRFRREAELLARLRHPSLVEVYEAGAQDGQPYLAMELVEGGSLADRLDRGPLAPRAAAGLVRDVARAVRAAHLCGITHRDIKPANVLLSNPDDGQPKLSDFGLARLDDPASRLTHTGVAAGTPAYMAPEQADPRVGPLGPPADVWALGAVLYECLAGRPPFTGETPADLFRKLLEQDPLPLAGVPHDLAVICLKCLRKVPADRYPTAGELADDLDRFLAGEPVRARPVADRRGGVEVGKAPAVGGRAGGRAGRGDGPRVDRDHPGPGPRPGRVGRGRPTGAGRRRRARPGRAAALASAGSRRPSCGGGRMTPAPAAGLLAACPVERRGWEWEYLDGLLRSAVARADAETAPDAWHPVGGSINDLAFTADGSRLVTLGGGNPFQLNPEKSGPASAVGWDPATGTPVGPWLMAAAHSRAWPSGRTGRPWRSWSGPGSSVSGRRPTAGSCRRPPACRTSGGCTTGRKAGSG